VRPEVARPSWRLAARAFTSVLLGCLLVSGAAFPEKWLPIGARETISDAVALPGLLIARIFYPAGVHTAGGAPEWGAVFLVSSVLFYSLLWFAVLTLANLPRRRARAQ